jgi:hypothetical protein
MAKKKSAEIIVPMAIDVDGAPNAYGPNDREALDFELNAHVGAKKSGKIVGYLTENDDGETPVVQKKELGDPFPSFFISTTAYADKNNSRREDPRRYVNAAEINYALWAKAARNAGVKKGDFSVAHSLRTRQTVYAIVGDSGNNSGAEGSLALLQRLGYDVKNGKAGGEDEKKIVVRYFANTNPDETFFFNQADLEAAAIALDLDTDFSEFHAGDPGKLVLDAVGHTGGELRVERDAPFVPLPDDQEAPPYPRHLIKLDSEDTESVKLIQKRLRDLGFTEPGPDGAQRPLSVDGGYGTHTADAVELFQMRHSDVHGRPLEVDGKVGSDTWGALFGRETMHFSPPEAEDELLAKVLEVAAGEIGVREKPPGSNRGDRVEEYQASVGIDPGEPWCVAFIFFCFVKAAKDLAVDNRMAKRRCKTGCVLDLWDRARANGVTTVVHDSALDDPSKVAPGMIFIISTGSGHGHAGLVVSVTGNRLETFEGNTNDGGSREGIGVFRRTGRTIDSINRGFIDFSAA